MNTAFANPSFLLPADADTGILADFIVESCEHLESSDQNLLILEADPGNRDSLDAVFRAFHSIKGVAGFLGLEGIKILAHEAENLLDRIRTGAVRLDPAVMDCVFESVGFLKGAVSDLKRGVTAEDDARCQAASAALRQRIQAILTGEAGTQGAEAEGPAWTAAEGPEGGEAPIADKENGTAAAPAPGPGTAPKPEGAGKPAAPALAGALKETVKVDAARLDRLLNSIGELVIA